MLVVVIVILVVIGFSSLEYTQIGLKQSWLTSSIDSEPFEAGRFFLGPGNSFLKFPNTLQTIAFANEAGGRDNRLKSRTLDGLEVDVDCSFQYQLSKNSIYQLYNKFGPEYADIFTSIATESIAAEATRYTASFWFTNFTQIQGELEGKIQLVFNTTAFADVTNFQLNPVGLPKDFEHEIQETQVKNTDIQTAISKRNATRVQQETQVLQAGRRGQEININADATAQAILLDVRGWIEPYTLQQKAQASAYADLYPEFGSDSAMFMDYLRVRVARDHPMESAIYSHQEA